MHAGPALRYYHIQQQFMETGQIKGGGLNGSCMALAAPLHCQRFSFGGVGGGG